CRYPFACQADESDETSRVSFVWPSSSRHSAIKTHATSSSPSMGGTCLTAAVTLSCSVVIMSLPLPLGNRRKGGTSRASRFGRLRAIALLTVYSLGLPAHWHVRR